MNKRLVIILFSSIICLVGVVGYFYFSVPAPQPWDVSDTAVTNTPASSESSTARPQFRRELPRQSLAAPDRVVTSTLKSAAGSGQPVIEQSSVKITNTLLVRIAEWKLRFPNLFKDNPDLEAQMLSPNGWGDVVPSASSCLYHRLYETQDEQAVLVEIIVYLCQMYSSHLSFVDYPNGEVTNDIIIKLLTHSDQTLKQGAFYYVRHFNLNGADMSGAVPVLIRLLDDPDAATRQGVIPCLSALGATGGIPKITERLADESAGVRAAAAYALGQMGAKEALPAIVRLLVDDDSQAVRYNVILALRDLKADETIPELLKLLSSPDETLRGIVIDALGGLDAQAAVPAIMGLLSDRDPEVRTSAMRALCNLNARAAIPRILELLNDPDPGVRSDLMYMLADIQAKEAIPALRKLLSEASDTEDKTNAIYALGRLDDRESVPLMVKFLAITDTSYSAANALETLAGPGDAALIRPLLNGNDNEIRQYAIKLLGKIGDRASIPDLTKLLVDDTDYQIRVTAAQTLADLGAQDALPGVIKIMQDASADRWHRIPMMDIALKLGGKDKIPEIAKLLQDDDYVVKASAIGALAQAGAKEMIPDLTTYLNDDLRLIRGCVAVALIELGAKDKVPLAMAEDIKSTFNWGWCVGGRARAALDKLEK